MMIGCQGRPINERVFDQNSNDVFSAISVLSHTKMEPLRIALKTDIDVHILPESTSKCEYSNNTLLINGATISASAEDRCFVGQIVGNTIHLIPIKSVALAAYPERTVRKDPSNFSNLPTEYMNAPNDSGDEAAAVKEVIIQQSVRRNAIDHTKPKGAQWKKVDIIKKDCSSELMAKSVDGDEEDLSQRLLFTLLNMMNSLPSCTFLLKYIIVYHRVFNLSRLDCT